MSLDTTEQKQQSESPVHGFEFMNVDVFRSILPNLVTSAKMIMTSSLPPIYEEIHDQNDNGTRVVRNCDINTEEMLSPQIRTTPITIANNNNNNSEVLYSCIMEQHNNDELKREIYKSLLKNTLLVLKCLCEYYRNHEWVLKDFQLSKREVDCVSLDWLDQNLYCCVYPDLIAIDRVDMKNDMETSSHIGQEFVVKNEESILNQFIPTFAQVSNGIKVVRNCDINTEEISSPQVRTTPITIANNNNDNSGVDSWIMEQNRVMHDIEFTEMRIRSNFGAYNGPEFMSFTDLDMDALNSLFPNLFTGVLSLPPNNNNNNNTTNNNIENEEEIPPLEDNNDELKREISEQRGELHRLLYIKKCIIIENERKSKIIEKHLQGRLTPNPGFDINSKITKIAEIISRLEEELDQKEKKIY